MDVALNVSEEQTPANLTTINLKNDITNIFLNPHLVNISQEQFWMDGVVLSAISCFGILSNLYLISRLAVKCTTSECRLMGILAVTDLLVLVVLGLTRAPLVFAGPAWTHNLSPTLMFYLLPLEKGILTFSSFMFLIFAGERFLQTAEQRTYTCINTILFCAGMSALITAATYLELDLQTLTLDEVEEEVGVAASSLLVLSEENLVVSHTELFHDTTYSQLVRLLLNFICSQVSVVWFLPIIFLQSKHLNQLNRKYRRRRDLLTPVISLLYILLSSPNLAVLLYDILLYQPPPLLVRLSVLCLALISAVKLTLYLSLDKSLRRELLYLKTHRAVPSREY